MAIVKPLEYNLMNEKVLVDPRNSQGKVGGANEGRIIGTMPNTPTSTSGSTGLTNPIGGSTSGLPASPLSGGASGSSIFPNPVGTQDEFSEIYKRSQNALLKDPTQPKTQDEIYQERLKQSQGLIDSINQNFYAQENAANIDAKERDKLTRQSLISQGLAGSSAAVPGIKATDKTNDAIMQTIQAQKANQIQGVLSGVQKYADEEFVRQRELLKAEAEGNLDMVDKIRKNKLESANKAVSDFTNFAGMTATSPLTWKELTELDPEMTQAWKNATGKDDLELSMLMNSAKAGAGKITWNDKLSHYDEKRGVMIMVGTKGDGSTVVQEQATQTQVPAGYKPQMLGDQMFLINENGIQVDENGNITGLMPYGSPGQFDTDKSKKLVTIDGKTYEVDAQGNYVTPNIPSDLMQNTQKSLDQIELVEKSIKNAEALVGRSGSNTWWEKAKQGAFGNTGYTNLIAETNTLRTNVLTMMTDPSIKKFFGPQMSNADVQLMTSAGTSLNPELQSPAQMQEELNRLKDLVKRAKAAVQQGINQGGSGGQIIEYNGKKYQTDADGNFDPNSPLSFNSAGNALASKGSTPYLKTLGAVTGIDGSSYWKHGLDIDLKKGDPVKSPVSGQVLAVGNNGGFGKQVKIKGSDGKEYWLSHLDGYKVKVGDRIDTGQVIGVGGNTGKTIALGGGDGSHLDLTVKDKNGNYIPPRQIKKMLDNIYV